MKTANRIKTLKLTAIALVMIISCTAKAQVSVNVNIGSPPAWGPEGSSGVQYYYLPDVEAYYDVQDGMFIYLDGGVWRRHHHLAGRYRDYDLYGGYKVVMTGYRGDRPYDNFKEYRVKYARGYRGGGEQKTVGQRPENSHPTANRPAPSHPTANRPAQSHPAANRPSPSHTAANRPAQSHTPQGHPNNNMAHSNPKSPAHAPQKAAPHGNENGQREEGHGEGKGR